MSIDKLRYFAAVVETRNLRKASELVGISPPSMSKAISVLENELGYKLIHPEGRGIGITPDGLKIYKLSASLIEEHKLFYSQIKDFEAKSNTLKIATFEIFSTYFLTNYFSKESHSEVLLLELTPGHIEPAILNGSIDYGITYLPAPSPKLEFREIGSFIKNIYGIEKWKNIPFSDWPFVVPTTELNIHSLDIDSLDMWPKGAPKRNIKYRVEQFETAIQTSRKGLSVLHCPDFIIQLHNNEIHSKFHLVQLPKPNGYKSNKPTKIYLVGKKGTIPDQLERKLAKFIRSIR